MSTPSSMMTLLAMLILANMSSVLWHSMESIDPRAASRTSASISPGWDVYAGGCLDNWSGCWITQVIRTLVGLWAGVEEGIYCCICDKIVPTSCMVVVSSIDPHLEDLAQPSAEVVHPSLDSFLLTRANFPVSSYMCITLVY